MLKIEKINTRDKKQVKRFIDIHFRLYMGHPQWVPPLRIDCAMQLNRDKHPFYEHSDADFFIVSRDGRDIGRIAALENKPYNEYHHARQGQFYLFDCEDDQEVASALFGCVFDWARQRGLESVIGPKGFGVVDGYGLLERGYEHRQLMNMMNYNYPYYVGLVEAQGMEKEVDFISCHISADTFHLPDRIHSIAERVQTRGTLHVQRFRNKKELRQWADRIGKAYNQAFVNNWEYYPLTEREIKFLLDNLLIIADPAFIKIISHEDEAVGFLFGFPDVSAAMQRAKGKLLPFGMLDILMEVKRTSWIGLNGAGILPEFQGRGGNALLYSEMENTMKSSHFHDADLTQVAETAVQMRNDLMNLGVDPYKNHRVYHKSLE